MVSKKRFCNLLLHRRKVTNKIQKCRKDRATRAEVDRELKYEELGKLKRELSLLIFKR